MKNLVKCPYASKACDDNCLCAKPHKPYKATMFTDYCNKEPRPCRVFGKSIKCVPCK